MQYDAQAVMAAMDDSAKSYIAECAEIGTIPTWCGYNKAMMRGAIDNISRQYIRSIIIPEIEKLIKDAKS